MHLSVWIVSNKQPIFLIDVSSIVYLYKTRVKKKNGNCLLKLLQIMINLKMYRNVRVYRVSRITFLHHSESRILFYNHNYCFLLLLLNIIIIIFIIY